MAAPTKIIVFYHMLLRMGDPPKVLPQACAIVTEQFAQMKESGLLESASEVIVGLNDSEDGLPHAKIYIPAIAKIVLHGLDSHSECLTIVEIEKWLKNNPDPAYIFYAQSKGATHPADSDYGNRVSAPWRHAMMGHLVTNWRQCVSDLDGGFEAAGCNWLTGMGWDKSQNIFGGNFWWARSDFLRTLPSIYERQRIKDSGIAAAESRYEAEVWIGNGPRLPKVAVYHPGGM